MDGRLRRYTRKTCNGFIWRMGSYYCHFYFRLSYTVCFFKNNKHAFLQAGKNFYFCFEKINVLTSKFDIIKCLCLLVNSTRLTSKHQHEISVTSYLLSLRIHSVNLYKHNALISDYIYYIHCS